MSQTWLRKNRKTPNLGLKTHCQGRPGWWFRPMPCWAQSEALQPRQVTRGRCFGMISGIRGGFPGQLWCFRPETMCVFSAVVYKLKEPQVVFSTFLLPETLQKKGGILHWGQFFLAWAGPSRMSPMSGSAMNVILRLGRRWIPRYSIETTSHGTGRIWAIFGEYLKYLGNQRKQIPALEWNMDPVMRRFETNIRALCSC